MQYEVLIMKKLQTDACIYVQNDLASVIHELNESTQLGSEFDAKIEKHRYKKVILWFRLV